MKESDINHVKEMRIKYIEIFKKEFQHIKPQDLLKPVHSAIYRRFASSPVYEPILNHLNIRDCR